MYILYMYTDLIYFILLIFYSITNKDQIIDYRCFFTVKCNYLQKQFTLILFLTE